MLTESRPGTLDLLVVGGLTVDRFDGGSSAPGGSVIHIARAAAPRGVRLGIATAAGPEAVAAAGVAELERVAARLEVASGPATSTFRHREGDDRRRLWLERAGGEVALGPEARDRFATRAVLFAPVAKEIGADALRVWDEALPRGAILQGWLRAVAEDREVTQLPFRSPPTASRWPPGPCTTPPPGGGAGHSPLPERTLRWARHRLHAYAL